MLARLGGQKIIMMMIKIDVTMGREAERLEVGRGLGSECTHGGDGKGQVGYR